MYFIEQIDFVVPEHARLLDKFKARADVSHGGKCVRIKDTMAHLTGHFIPAFHPDFKWKPSKAEFYFNNIVDRVGDWANGQRVWLIQTASDNIDALSRPDAFCQNGSYVQHGHAEIITYGSEQRVFKKKGSSIEQEADVLAGDIASFHGRLSVSLAAKRRAFKQAVEARLEDGSVQPIKGARLFGYTHKYQVPELFRLKKKFMADAVIEEENITVGYSRASDIRVEEDEYGRLMGCAVEDSPAIYGYEDLYWGGEEEDNRYGYLNVSSVEELQKTLVEKFAKKEALRALRTEDKEKAKMKSLGALYRALENNI